MKHLVSLVLIVVDVLVTVLLTLLVIFIRAKILPLLGIEPFTPVRNYLSLWPALLLLVFMRGLFALYPGYGLNPADELRRETIATFFVACFTLAGGALFQFNTDYSRIVIVLTCFFLFLVLPMARALVKLILSHSPIYGENVWIVGVSERANELKDILIKTPILGLRVLGQSAGEPPQNITCPHCLLVPDGINNLSTILDDFNKRFKKVWLVPNLLDVASVWLTPRDLQGHLALELRNNLLLPRNKFIKRFIDLNLSFVIGILTLPIMISVALWIKFDSKGPVFLRQTRLGKGAKPFTMYKFRTMHTNAEDHLETYLAKNSKAKTEWDQTRKLRSDPRITRPGYILRRFSIDELPQIWNVFRGEMSFVGPRPIMADELDWYANKAHLYTQVRPGLTGLFQILGRSELSYDQRVRLDAYYVRNWSVWLDIYIISRTLFVVLSSKGAY